MGTVCGNVFKIPFYPYKSSKVNKFESILQSLKTTNTTFNKGFSIFIDACVDAKCLNELQSHILTWQKTSKAKSIDVYNLFDFQLSKSNF